MKNQWLILLTTSVCALLMALTLFLYMQVKSAAQPAVSITSFEECKSAGYPVMESYPEQCRTPEGVTFVQEIVPPVEEPGATATESTFGVAEPMSIGSRVSFPDGLRISLKEINDSRCKPDVQCIWAGELAPLFTVTGGEFGELSQEVRLGTTANKSVALRGYIFELQSATESQAVIVVKKNSEPDDQTELGYVLGHVDIGPVCPVEDIDNPCVIPPETYTSRSAVVYEDDQQTIKKTVALDTSGNYKLSLPIGTYYIQIKPAGIRAGELKKVIVTPQTEQVVNFDIDTGIR